MGLQENQRREQKEKEILKRAFLIIVTVLIGSFIFNEIQEKYYQSKMALLRFGKSKIEDFLIVGKSEDRFIVRGSTLIDKGNEIDIDQFVLSYIKNQGDIFNINSNKAIYYKEKEILTLLEDVDFISKSFMIKTSKVTISLKDKIAKNKEDVFIKSKNFTTYGKNLLIDFPNEEIHLQQVKSVIRGI